MPMHTAILRPAQAQNLAYRPLSPRPIRLSQCVTYASFKPETPPQTSFSRILSGVLGASAAAILLTAAPSPALAELQTVSPDQATSMAKPLQVQSVNKGQIWLVLVLGASSLFGVTVLLENNEAWFPAIYRANRAMAAATKKMAEKNAQQVGGFDAEQAQFEERLKEVEQERMEDAWLENAVLAGLNEAKTQVRAGAPATAAAEVTEQFPAVLDAPTTWENTGISEIEDEENSSEESEASSIAGVNDVDENGKEDSRERRAPLFEISSEQIEASTRGMNGRLLSEMSLEELQEELERRQAAAAAGNGSSD